MNNSKAIQNFNGLDKILYRLPVLILGLILFFRSIITLTLIIVGVDECRSFNNNFLNYLYGIALAVGLEILLTVLSLLNAQFRSEISKTAANGGLVIIVLLTIFASVLMEQLNFNLNIYVMINLHIFNFISILLSEWIGFLVKTNNEKYKENKEISFANVETVKETQEIIVETKKFPLEILEIKNNNALSFKDKAKEIMNFANYKDFFKTNKQFADFLQTTPSTITKAKENKQLEMV